MTKKIYLETLKSVLGRSISHCWEAAKISVLSSRKIEKHEYLTGEEISTQ